MSGQNEHKNPIPNVDTIIDNDSQVLFIERSNEPFKGKMVLSGGFVRIGETVKEAVIREVKEETYLDVYTWIIYSVFFPILTETQEVTLCQQYLLEKYHLKVLTRIQKQVMALLRQDGR